MNHTLIEFPIFDGSLTGEPMSKPRSAVTSNGGRVKNVAQQTKLPPRKTPGNKNLGQLVGAAKALLDYYRPVIEELSTEAQERDLYHLLEKALAPFLREAAARGGSPARQRKPHSAKIHIVQPEASRSRASGGAWSRLTKVHLESATGIGLSDALAVPNRSF